ncbi:MAG: DNA replication and repair protein RecF [Syntrophomonadaceae bacterium]|nr:DNA replication and repair protein RecF [Bacillota bacterium]
MDDLQIKQIDIKNFRCFKEVSLKLGKTITVIAGQNATGKSTLLGLLGHCAELKSKEARTLLRQQFRTEFGEIIKASNEFDKKCSEAYIIRFLEGNTQWSLSFRTTFQEGDRFRIIPKKTPARNSEKKAEWPTFYLGLSRLYPIGESEQAKTSSSRLTKEQKDKFFLEYKKILSLNETPLDCSDITIQETTKKKTVGIRTEFYDAMCNSAGQDNLSQILLAVFSFESLKEQRKESWNGGLLLIDELDATLHPAAQHKLLDYLYKSAKDLGIQIVFTTHSLSLLEKSCEKTEHNSQTEVNNYEVVYLTTRNGALELLPNPSYDTVYLDMLNTLSILRPESRKITVYTEDEEARWLLKKLLGANLNHIRLPEISLGYSELLKLLKGDYSHFCNIIFVLDGDAPQAELDALPKPAGSLQNILKLPKDGLSPEKTIFEYLKNLPGDSAVFSELAATGLSKRTVDDHGPDSFASYARERERNKAWFKQTLSLIERIYPYWELKNKSSIQEFTENFVRAFNTIAKRVGAPKI